MENEKFILIGKHGKKNIYTCNDCNKTFQALASGIKRGDKPCACGKNFYKNSEFRLFKVLTHCIENDLSLLEYQDDSSGRRNITIKTVRNHCSHINTQSWSNLITSNNGCYQCIGNRPKTIEQVTSELLNLCEKRKLNYKFLSSYKSYDDIQVTCKLCNHVGKTTIAQFINSNYSCVCQWDRGFRVNKEASFYVHLVSDLNSNTKFIKIGISRHPETRYGSLKNNNLGFNFQKMYQWNALGIYCREFEDFCKKNFIIFENNLKDGKTECFSLENLAEIKVLADTFFEEKEGTKYGFADGY